MEIYLFFHPVTIEVKALYRWVRNCQSELLSASALSFHIGTMLFSAENCKPVVPALASYGTRWIN